MARVFKSDLSVKGLRQLKKELRNYQQLTLSQCVSEFLYELSEEGIRVCKINSGKYGAYLGYTKIIQDSKYTYKKTALLICKNEKPNIVTWYKHNGTPVTAEVNSLMMAEFGSGFNAKPGYQGTFPNQQWAFGYKGKNHWYYSHDLGPDGKATNWQKSDGEKPLEPLEKAAMQMRVDIDRIARNAFKLY